MTTPLLECTVLQLGLASISLAGRWVCPECRGEIASVLVAEPAVNAHRAGCSRRPTLPWQPSDGPREKPVTHEQIAALFTVDEIRAALSDRASYLQLRPPVLNNRREKLRAERKDVGDRAVLTCAALGLDAHESDMLRAVIMYAFSAGYEAAEPDVCARCGGGDRGGEMTKRDYSSCGAHDWWTSAADIPCPTCARLDALRAELRWCDAERRLALRALAEYAPACDDCAREVMERVRSDRNMHLATTELRGRVYCDEHMHADRPLVYAAQIAAADEETR